MANEASPKETPRPPDGGVPPKPEIITPELIAALKSLGLDPKTQAEVSRAIEISMTLIGPLPPPGILAGYSKAVPGLAEKMVEWVEQQRNFRQSQEKIREERTQTRMDRGQLIAGSVALVGLALLATIASIWGNPFVAGVIAVVAIGGPTAAVYLARRGVRSSPTPSPALPIFPAASTHTSPPIPERPLPAP